VNIASPSISEALESFLKEQKLRLSLKTYAKYEDVVRLLTSSLDGYAHQSLAEDERKSWEKRWQQDELANSFANSFGPEKIPENIPEFLGYFMVKKVLAGQELLKASATVTRKLLVWLKDKDLIEEAGVDDALAIVDELGPDLPKAEELSYILGTLCLEPPSGRLLEEWEDDYPTIEKIEPGKIWFRGESTVGPVVVPKRATDIAKVGWNVSAVYVVRTGEGWRMSEVGNVYP